MNTNLIQWMEQQPENIQKFLDDEIRKVNPFYRIDNDKDACLEALRNNDLTSTQSQYLLVRLLYLNNLIDDKVHDEILLDLHKAQYNFDATAFLIKEECSPRSNNRQLISKLLRMTKFEDIDWFTNSNIDTTTDFHMEWFDILPDDILKPYLKHNMRYAFYQIEFEEENKTDENNRKTSTLIKFICDNHLLNNETVDKLWIDDLEALDAFLNTFIQYDSTLLRYLNSIKNSVLNKVLIARKEDGKMLKYSNLFITLCATAVACNNRKITTALSGKLKKLIPIIKCYDYNWDTCYEYIVNSYMSN